MSNSTIEVTELMQDIMDGKFDTEEMDRIQHAITLRKQNVQRLEAANLNIGDIIRLQNIKPKYLTGLELVVKSRRGVNVYVDFPVDPQAGRFSGAKDVKLKPSMVQLVRRARPELSV